MEKRKPSPLPKVSNGNERMGEGKGEGVRSFREGISIDYLKVLDFQSYTIK